MSHVIIQGSFRSHSGCWFGLLSFGYINLNMTMAIELGFYGNIITPDNFLYPVYLLDFTANGKVMVTDVPPSET